MLGGGCEVQCGKLSKCPLPTRCFCVPQSRQLCGVNLRKAQGRAATRAHHQCKDGVCTAGAYLCLLRCAVAQPHDLHPSFAQLPPHASCGTTQGPVVQGMRDSGIMRPRDGSCLHPTRYAEGPSRRNAANQSLVVLCPDHILALSGRAMARPKGRCCIPRW